MWVGTVFSGLVKFNGTTWITYNISNSGLPDNNIRSLAMDLNGSVWIGTGDGLAKFDGFNWEIFNTSNSDLPGNKINSIAIDENGIIWIGTNNKGLASFNDESWTVYNTSNSGLPSDRVLSINIDSYGNKWIGTYGLVKFNDTIWSSFDVFNSGLANNEVTSIVIDQLGSKWIGTMYGGLSEYNENGIPFFTDENIVNKNKVNIFPNPASKELFVSIECSESVNEIIIYNQLGHKVLNEKITNYKTDVSMLEDGVYVVEVITKSYRGRSKLIIK
jgi:ligand-binding sensor domain-containing protein